MSEQFSAVASTQSVPEPAKRPERRQMRRAGIALLVRVRAADFHDGNFDEVQTTQNASRKAIYFFTKLDRYYKGMRVRVTSPYDPNAGAANLEQIGEVARVHRREAGFGVAIAMVAGAGAHSGTTQVVHTSNAVPQASMQILRPDTTESRERRCANRSPFIAPVEMVEMRTGSRIQARTSDLSLQGCYVDTLNPLPVAAAVRLQIHRGGLILDVLANVSSRHAGSGMGLVFGEISAGQKAVLQSWLDELEFPRAVPQNPFPRENAGLREPDCAERLVGVLLRKGVLTQSEATEILGERATDQRVMPPLRDAV